VLGGSCLLPKPDSPAFGGREWFPTCVVLAHVIGGDLEAAAAAGHWDLAEGHSLSALALVDEIGHRVGKPSVQRWYAWMLRRRDEPGERDRARTLLDEAIPGFRALGMNLTLGQAEALRALC